MKQELPFNQTGISNVIGTLESLAYIQHAVHIKSSVHLIVTSPKPGDIAHLVEGYLSSIHDALRSVSNTA